MAAGLFIWGFIQSFLVGIIIPLVKKARNNNVLSLIFIVTALNIFIQYLLRYQDVKFSAPELMVVPDMLDMFLPTLVLIYIGNMMGKPYDQKRLRYFVVPTLWSVVLLGYLVLYDKFTFESYIGGTSHTISLAVILAWKVLLFIKGCRLFRFEDLSLKQKQQSILLWPRLLLIFLGLLTFTALSNFLYFLIVGTNYADDAVVAGILQAIEYKYILLTCSIIFITLFFAFKYPKILSGLPVVKSTEVDSFPEAATYEKELMQLIDLKKIYLDTQLNERKLAEAMGIHSYLLSRLLNEHLGKSFSAFINEKRVQEAQRILAAKENHDLTIYAVALDSGFQSESVFYVNFKKITGYTPAQYKKTMRAKKKNTSVKTIS